MPINIAIIYKQLKFKPMKKFIMIALVLLSAVQLSFAQDDKPSKFGIRAGYHAAMISRNGNQVAGTVGLNTFYVGIFKEKKLIPMLHFGSGIEYFQNGFESNLIDLKRKLHYVSVPMYLKVKLGPFYATGGTALNFKIAENIKFLDESMDPLSEKSKIFDMPLQVGVGFKILMVSIEARYNWGMMNINDIGIKNQYLQVGLGVSF